jgi:hypothetical protein
VSLDSSCELLRWMCFTEIDYVSLDNSFVLLQWMCSTRSGYVSLDNTCVLLWFERRLDGIVVVVCY